jgi:drug/metabolite transporter (DMT)-like permease
MNWIAADLLMFVCSVGVYLAVRKATLDKLPPQFNNLAMFAIPLAVFVIADAVTHPSFAISFADIVLIILTGVVFSYLGNAMSMLSIELAPNAGYSLVVSKSYVVLTSLLAVPLFGAPLTIQNVISIALIVGFSALIMIDPKSSRQAKSST